MLQQLSQFVHYQQIRSYKQIQMSYPKYCGAPASQTNEFQQGIKRSLGEFDRNRRNEPQIVANRILEQIIEDAKVQIKRNQFLSKNLLKYSNCISIMDIDEVNNLYLNEGELFKKQKEQEKEPKAVLIDSLMPISADIDPENLFRKSLSKCSLLGVNQVKLRMKQRGSIVGSKEKYQKLQMTETSEQDGFTKELRRNDEEKNNKIENERRAIEIKEKLRQEKLKGKKEEENFCYDYNGEMLEVKMENKANLVSRLISGATESHSKVIKGASIDLTPVILEGSSMAGINKTKKSQPQIAGMKRKDEVQFSDPKSVANHLKTTYGVKFISEGKTIEQKKRVMSTMELKKSLSSRKISKEEYKILKSLNENNREELGDYLKKSSLKVSEIKSQRAHSEAKFTETYSNFRKSKEIIHVNSTNLKEKLMEKVVKVQQPASQVLGRKETFSSQIKLGLVDHFNLEYIKAGSSLQSKTSRDGFDQTNINNLPKIIHTTLYSKMRPKGREKIKDSNEILREMRKRFQEKLRV